MLDENTYIMQLEPLACKDVSIRIYRRRKFRNRTLVAAWETPLSDPIYIGVDQLHLEPGHYTVEIEPLTRINSFDMEILPWASVEQ